MAMRGIEAATSDLTAVVALLKSKGIPVEVKKDGHTAVIITFPDKYGKQVNELVISYFNGH